MAGPALPLGGAFLGHHRAVALLTEPLQSSRQSRCSSRAYFVGRQSRVERPIALDLGKGDLALTARHRRATAYSHRYVRSIG
jgi:hypothetical protein